MPPPVWLAGPDEAETVGRLLVEFRDLLGTDWPSENAILASVERLLEDRETEFLVSAPDEDAAPAGVCQLRYRWAVWTAAPDCWLEDLYVTRAARGRGVGVALVEAALERARARGCRRIELDTSEGNQAALRLYERMGFSPSSKSDAPTRDLFLGRRLE